MNRQATLLATIVFFSASAAAQITVNQNDFASAGTTVYLSTGQLNPFLNFSATGANMRWDFSSLRSSGQRQTDFLHVSATHFVYSLYYADIFFNPNRSNIALEGTDIPLSQALGITNPYTFYYKNSKMYKKVGYGGELAGLPVPLAMTIPDTIYQFPMNYGDSHSGRSAYSMTIPGVLTSAYSQVRNTTIDGWGTVITPYGTFDVLRSKSEVFGTDSVFIDSLGIGINVPRPKVTEYKWIAKNEKVPVLQINTSTIFGAEIINLILFKDNRLFIVADSIAGTLCPGAPVTVHYTASGTFNPPAFLQMGNRFTVQLSSSSGSFANPVSIGNVVSTASGTISCTIPNNTAGGTGYRIRIISSSPADTSDVYGPLTINSRPAASITASGAAAICEYDSLVLTANSGIGFGYQWRMNNADISGATAQSHVAKAAGDYTVVVSNVCGSATSQKLAVTVNPQPVHAITASDTSTCDGSPITVTAFKVRGIEPLTYQWNQDGNAIFGAMDSVLVVSQSGDYTLLVSDAIGCTFRSEPLTLAIDSLPEPVIYANGSTAFCGGGSVTLTTDTSLEYAYQWQLNGVHISGATGYLYVAEQAGNYSVVVKNTCDSAVSRWQTVIIHPEPVHSVNPSSTLNCNGTPVAIAAINVSGALSPAYQWYQDGTAIAGATDSILTVWVAGNYSVAVSDANGCSFHSDAVNIGYDSIATPIIYAGGGTSFCLGGSVTLRTDSSDQYAYQWLLDGIAIDGANSYLYSAAEGGNYSVVLTLASGCSDTSLFTKVSVYPLPPVPVIIQLGDTLLTSTPAAGYQWYLDGTPLAGAVSQTFHPAVSGSYVVEITDATGCTNISEPYHYAGTGWDEVKRGKWQLKVTPNPVFNSALSIYSSELLCELSVFNATGVLVFKNHFEPSSSSRKYVIPLNSWAKGIYFLKLNTERDARVVKVEKM